MSDKAPLAMIACARGPSISHLWVPAEKFRNGGNETKLDEAPAGGAEKTFVWHIVSLVRAAPRRALGRKTKTTAPSKSDLFGCPSDGWPC